MTDYFPCDLCGREVETLYQHIDSPHSSCPKIMAVCQKCKITKGNQLIFY